MCSTTKKLDGKGGEGYEVDAPYGCLADSRAQADGE
jgi:hypothetical protein